MSLPTIYSKDGMVLIAGPFENTDADKRILGSMILNYQRTGTRFKLTTKNNHKEIYLWRDRRGYASGTNDYLEGKKSHGPGPVVLKRKNGDQAQPPRGKRHHA